MPLKYWEDVFVASTYLINRTPNRVIDYDTPLERLFQQKPDYSSLRIFGCACWPNLRPYNTHKFQFRSKQCVFLGYSPLHKGFKCLDPSTGRVYIYRDVTFDENVFPFSRLHPNAGARLRQEISLLPPDLRPPTCDQGGEQMSNHMFDSNNPCEDLCAGNGVDLANTGDGGDSGAEPMSGAGAEEAISLFARLISHQPAVLFSQNKPATSNQPAALFFQNKPAPAISHQPTEQAACCLRLPLLFSATRSAPRHQPGSNRHLHQSRRPIPPYPSWSL
jgi:hypothetical protein